MHRRGLPDFRVLKLSFDDTGHPDIRRVKIPDKYSTELLFGEVGSVGSGGNSGFQALNLAIQFGATRILLVGFDMDDRSGVHWYGRNNWHGANNPSATNFKRWLPAFGNAARQCADRGIKVVNCSPHSALRAFPKRSIDDMLSEWV